MWTLVIWTLPSPCPALKPYFTSPYIMRHRSGFLPYLSWTQFYFTVICYRINILLNNTCVQNASAVLRTLISRMVVVILK